MATFKAGDDPLLVQQPLSDASMGKIGGWARQMPFVPGNLTGYITEGMKAAEARLGKKSIGRDGAPLIDGEAFKRSYQKSFEEAHYLTENPAAAEPHYQQDEAVYFQTFADYAAGRDKALPAVIISYMKNHFLFLNEIVPIEFTRSNRYSQVTIEVGRDLPELGVDKVAGREIMTTTSREEGTLSYRIQGCSVDYEEMKEPAGMRRLNLLVDAITANMWAMIAAEAIEAFIRIPSKYVTPTSQFPFAGRPPTTVRRLFQLEAETVLALNKGPQRIHHLIERAGEIFSQTDNEVDKLIMSPEDKFYINMRDPTQLYTHYSGGQALKNRSTGAKYTTKHGVTIYTLPMLGTSIHDGVTNNFLQRPFATGTFAIFRDHSLGMAPGQYRAFYRDIKYCSHATGDRDTYTFRRALSHLLEFNPLSSADRPGYPNAAVLTIMAKDEVATEIYSKTQCIRNGNEEFHSTFLRHIGPEGRQMGPDGRPTDQSKCEWAPIVAIGEMAYSQCKAEYLEHPQMHLAAALCHGLTDEDKNAFSDGIALCEELRSAMLPAAVLNQIIAASTLRRCTSELSERDPAKNAGDSPTYYNANMTAPNMRGGCAVPNTFGGSLPFGFGTYAGMASISDALLRGGAQGMPARVATLIPKFVSAYRKVVRNLISTTAMNEAVNQKMVHFYNNSPASNSFERACNVAWTSVVSNFVPPLMYAGPASTLGLVTQDNPGGGVALVAGAPSSTSTRPSSEDYANNAKFITALGGPNGTSLENYKAIFGDKTQKAVLNLMKQYNRVSGKAAADARAEIQVNFTNLSPMFTAANAADVLALFANPAVIASLNRVTEYNCDQDGTFQMSRATSATPTGVFTDAYLQSASGVVMQLHFSPEAITEANGGAGATYGYPELVAVYEETSELTGVKYAFAPPTDSNCNVNFPTTDKHMAGGTSLTAYPYVDGRLPFLPRSGKVIEQLRSYGLHASATLSDDSERSARFLNRAPAHDAANTEADVQAFTKMEALQFRTDTDGMDRVRAAFPWLSEFAVNAIAFPILGSADFDELTAFERRWVDSHKHEGITGVAARALLLQSMCLQGLFRLHEKDIPVPLCVINFRPIETLYAYSIIALAAGPVGTTFFSGFDNTQGNDQHSKHTSLQFFMRHATHISERAKFYIMENVRGGAEIGGKGNLYFNEGIDIFDESAASIRVVANFGDAAKMGHYSNIATLAGYNVAIEGLGDATEIDIRGNNHTPEYAGRLTDTTDFPALRAHVMYPGQNFIRRALGDALDVANPQFATTQLSFGEKSQLRENNRVCSAGTVWFTNARGEEEMQAGTHLFGIQTPSRMKEEQSLADVPIPVQI